MSVSTDWLQVQNVLVPPNVNVGLKLDVALPYLATIGEDVSAVILQVRAAVAEVVNSATTSLSLAAVSAAAAAVPGVENVRRVLLDGVAEDAAAASFLTRPEFVTVDDVRIIPT